MERNDRDRGNRQDDLETRQAPPRAQRTPARAQQQEPQEEAQNQAPGRYSLDEIVNEIALEIKNSRASRLNSEIALVDRKKILGMLDELYDAMPREIFEARRTMQDRERIIQSAQRTSNDLRADAEARVSIIIEEANQTAKAIKAEADTRAARCIDEAQKQARSLISQEQVRRIAEDEAKRMLASSREKAEENIRQAQKYVDDMLNELGTFLNAKLGDVEKSRETINGKRS